MRPFFNFIKNVTYDTGFFQFFLLLFYVQNRFTQARVSSGICGVCAFFVFFTRSHPNVLQTSGTLGDHRLFQLVQKCGLYIRMSLEPLVLLNSFFQKRAKQKMSP